MKTVTVLLVFAAAVQSCLQPAMAADYGWYIGPRIGFSYATGHLGVEAQRGHLGIAAGVAMCPVFGNCLVTTALKYYLNETGRSWSIGLAGAWWDHESGDETSRLLGIGAEHRWRFGSGWDLSAGLAYARANWGEGDHDKFLIPSISWGYSFSFHDPDAGQ